MSHTITRGARRSDDMLNVRSISGWCYEVEFDESGGLIIRRLAVPGTQFIFPIEAAVVIADFIRDRVEEVPSPKYRLVED